MSKKGYNISRKSDGDDMKDMKWIKEGYFAHRGLHNDNIPENSISAFLNAIKNGYDIEMDVRVTKDRKIIVIHDKNLKRLCNVDLRIKDTNYEDIRKYTLLNTNEHIPLLKDVLDNLHKSTQLLIELKPTIKPKIFVELFLKLMSTYKFKYAVHSFDPKIIYQFKKQAPEIIRGQISSTFPKHKDIGHKFLKHMVYNFITKPDFINYRFEDLPRKRLDRLKNKGMMILSYTARSNDDLDFVRLKYDNAVFEGFLPNKKQNTK